MNYAHIISGTVSAYPFSVSQLRTLLAQGNPSVSLDPNANEAELASYGLLPVDEEPPEHAPRRQYVTLKETSQWTVQSDKVIATYAIHERTLQERRDILIPRIENMRWDKEVGGMAFGGVVIPTDDRAKTLIMGARTAAVEQGEEYSDEWKISPGVYVPLDAAAAVALGDALLAHIRACFAREKALILAVIDAQSHDELDDVENSIEEGWLIG
jgi:hypothetical protein